MDNWAKLDLIGVQSISIGSDQAQVILTTSSGEIECLFSPTEGGSGVIFVCGARGGFDGPSFGIFATLSQALQTEGISSLRLNYRLPGDFGECVLDVLVGTSFLEQKGINDIALVGHSFGGAVVIMAGAMSPLVTTVVGLSSQTYGAFRVDKLAPRPLLLIHGDRDQNLPSRCSQDIYGWANEPKELVIYPGCGHFLRECHEELNDRLKNWLMGKLGHKD